MTRTRMMRLARRVSGGVAAVLLVAACSSAADTSTTTSHSGVLKIGWSGPFTGPLQTMAQTMDDSAQLATDEINSKGGAGGRKLQWVVKDDANSPDSAVAQAQQFINNDKVELMVGPAVNTPFLPTRPYYAKAGITQFLVGTAATGIDISNFPSVYRLFFSGDAEAEMLIDYLANTRHLTKIGILVENTGSGLPGAQSLLRAVDLNGKVKVTSQQVFPSGESNLTSYVQAIQKSGAEGIALWSVGAPNTANVVKAMDALKYYVPVAGDIGADFKATPVLAGDALNRVDLVAGTFKTELYPVGGQPSAAAVQLRDKVEQKLSVSQMPDAVHLSIMYYNAVYVIAQALERSKGDTSEAAMRKALESGKFTTPMGDVYSFTATNHDGYTKDNLSLAKISAASYKDGFWQKADGAP